MFLTGSFLISRLVYGQIEYNYIAGRQADALSACPTPIHSHLGSLVSHHKTDLLWRDQIGNWWIVLQHGKT